MIHRATREHRPGEGPVVSLDQLCSRLAQAVDTHARVLVAGGGRSFSPLLRGPDEHVRLRVRLDGCTLPPTDSLHPVVAARKPVWVGAGTTYDSLERCLAQRGRTLLNQPGWSGLDVVGSTSSGSHGSGVDIRPMSDHVLAVRMVCVGSRGEIRPLQIESDEGVSAAASGHAVPSGVTLVRSTALLRAAVLSLGALGVITEMLFETQPAFHLSEERTWMRWPDAQQQLPLWLEDKSIHSLHVWLNPYARPAHAVISLLRRTDDPPSGERSFALRHGGKKLFRAIPHFLLTRLHAITPWAHALSLRAALASRVVRPSATALDLGSVNEIPVRGTALALDARDTIDATNVLLDALYHHGRQVGQRITTPLALRFVAASDAWLSPQSARTSCMIEVACVQGTPGTDRTLQVARTCVAACFDTRLHWGQDLGGAPESWLCSHPGVRQFAKARMELDPMGMFGAGWIHNALTTVVK